MMRIYYPENNGCTRCSDFESNNYRGKKGKKPFVVCNRKQIKRSGVE